MYLTAQRVVSKSGLKGINAFFHLHRNAKQPAPANHLDVVSVAERDTGKLIEDKCDVKPGGNRVKSYLDIVTSNEVDEKSLNAALDKFEKKIVPEKMGPIIDVFHGIGLRFNVELELYRTLSNEYAALRERAMTLLAHARGH
jgi:hypothetical protein